jgi:hypothetical protein
MRIHVAKCVEEPRALVHCCPLSSVELTVAILSYQPESLGPSVGPMSCAAAALMSSVMEVARRLWRSRSTHFNTVLIEMTPVAAFFSR